MSLAQINPMWLVSRQTIGQSGFIIKTRENVSVSAPATELATVFEILDQSEIIRKELFPNTIVVVMVQLLYDKAVEIASKHSARFSHVVLRMGTWEIFPGCWPKGYMHRRWD